MSKMEMQELSMQTRYVKEMLPLLKRIHSRKPVASKREKAKLIRLAADFCLVNAAGRHSKWGKALSRSLRRKNVPTHHGMRKRSAIETTDAGAAGGDGSLADACRSRRRICFSAKLKRNCNRHRHRPTQQKRCFRIDDCRYIIAKVHGLRYRYQGAVCCRGFSTLSSQSTSIHQRRCQAAYCRSLLRPRRTRSWFKKCPSTSCSRLQQSNMAKKVVAQRSPICKTYCNQPSIDSADTFNSESNNEGTNPDTVHDMHGRIEALQKLIPGGDLLMDQASLLEETALYILALQMQVHSLSALATISATPTHSIP
ncbi:hypothetical protein GOP47_0018273 [Adiantum capillus-veneris]|uniref:IBH1-like N-terminal domain-containing protein n=1 Tax=Adiantum capillus-veneris TaxID=13818 RepID=A0A9D4UH17_ADICA|nr:hypothetical protein GOP47_0018273 [Adiantum capillus-veneris]